MVQAELGGLSICLYALSSLARKQGRPACPVNNATTPSLPTGLNERGCWPGIDPVKMVQVFCYKGSDAHEEMRQACFDYLRLGGWYSAGPVSLLSGLNPRPSVLVLHFFAVAVFGVGRLLLPRPTLRCSASLQLLCLALASRL